MESEADTQRFRAGVAVEEGRRALDEQRRALEGLRTRMAGLVAVLGFVLGVRGLPDHPWDVVIIILVLVIVGLLILVLWPVEISANVASEVLVADPDWQIEPQDFLTALAGHMGEARKKNDERLARLHWVFVSCLVLVAAAVAVTLSAR